MLNFQPGVLSNYLGSVFNQLFKDKAMEKLDKYYLLRKFEAETEQINYPDQGYQSTAVKYQTEIIRPLKTFLENSNVNKLSPNQVLQHLETCFTYVPSDTYTGHYNDISLFDHSKLTAAIASCLYLFSQEKGVDNYKKQFYSSPKRYESYFMMVSGDLSGVQDFIYTIPSKGALKSLRARSFYLDLLLEHMTDEILEYLGLSRANLLYTGGGHFYMLLPNTQKAKDALKKVQNSFNEWFLRHYGTALYLAMAKEPCCPLDFMDDKKDNRPKASTNDMPSLNHKRNTADVFKSLSANLSESKLKRYTEDQLQKLMDPESDFNKLENNERECSVCKTSQKELEERDNIGVACENCDALYRFGKELAYKQDDKDKKVLIVTQEAYAPSLELPTLQEKDCYLHIMPISKKQEKRYKRLYTLNAPDSSLEKGINLWMGDYNKENPKKEGLIDFETLAKNGQGIKRLAVMRADVDNLGTAFSKGFAEELCTLSRSTALSRQLSLFFKFYINKICKAQIKGERTLLEPFKLTENSTTGDKNIVIVYAGGDDVFVVGAWLDVIEFAVDLRQAFKAYTCDRLSFSAGIGFFSDSYPIYLMASQTGELESVAKNYPGKNALALFGLDKTDIDGKKTENHTYHWAEFENVVEKLTYFNDNFAKEHFNKPDKSISLLYKLIDLLEKELEEGTYSINLARLAYLLSRMENACNEKQRKRLESINFKETLYTWASSPTERKQLLTAITLLVYLSRDKDKNKQKEMEVNN